jgi:hypothetical protein
MYNDRTIYHDDDCGTKREYLGLRIDAKLKKELEELARDNKRSLSGQVELILEQAINQ